MSSESPGRKRPIKSTVGTLVVLALAYFLQQQGIELPAGLENALGGGSSESPRHSAEAPDARGHRSDQAARIIDAFEARRSDVLVESVEGVVVKSLPDDTKGSQHQRFILRLAGGHTVLIAHNIDLAPRVPLREGDEVTVGGEYEWNDRGGVIHWTHHDPKGRHPGGFVSHRGKTYR